MQNNTRSLDIIVLERNLKPNIVHIYTYSLIDRNCVEVIYMNDIEMFMSYYGRIVYTGEMNSLITQRCLPVSSSISYKSGFPELPVLR